MLPFYIIIAHMYDGSRKYVCKDDASGGCSYLSDNHYHGTYNDDSYYKRCDTMSGVCFDDVSYLELKKIEVK